MPDKYYKISQTINYII